MQAGLVAGQCRDLAAAAFDVDRLGNLDDASLGLLLDDAGLLEGLDEVQARAVAAGQFGPVNLDLEVVDAQARAGRQAVLDRLDAGGAVAQARAARPAGKVVDPRGHGHLGLAIGAEEDDAGVGAGRRKRTVASSPPNRPRPQISTSFSIVFC